MLKRLKSFLSDSGLATSNRRLAQFVSASSATHVQPRVLDVGCGDGRRAGAPARQGTYGIEGDSAASEAARANGVHVVRANLEQDFPFASGVFDLVVTNQVVEHIRDLDRLFFEMNRVLRPGGQLVLATPNLASWNNIAALMLGQQAFSQSISSRYYLGNRFSRRYRDRTFYEYPQHCHILTSRGIQDILSVYGFRLTRLSGAGYFPISIPWLSRLDSRHAQYLIAWAAKCTPERNQSQVSCRF